MTTNGTDEVRIQQLEGLCRELADDRADVSLTRRGETGESDFVAIFTPHNKKAAGIEARLDVNFGVYLLLGSGAPFEVPFAGGYHTRSSWLDEVRAFCVAVINGNFREKLIFVDGVLRGSDHKLVLPCGKTVIEHWRKGIIAPWSKRKIRVVRYEPY